MTLTDTKDNITFGYVYVKEFTWINAHDNELHGGHPKNNKVYQVAFNKDTHSYRLFHDLNGDVMVTLITNLNAKDTDELIYQSDIVELNKNNILLCELDEDDLNSLCKWIDEDNDNIKQIMGLKASNDGRAVSPREMTKAFQPQLNDQEFMDFMQMAKVLKDNNEPLFDAVGDVIDFLNHHREVTVDTTVDTNWTNYSKTLGAGKNISKAIEHLARYGGEDRKTNMLGEDLVLGIKNLLIELSRRRFHGLHD